MLNRKFFALVVTLGLIPFSTFAGVKVHSLDLNVRGANGFLNIVTQGRSNELPDVKVMGKTIEIVLNKADAFNAIDKKMNGADLSASAVDGKAIIKAVLPYAVSADAIELAWKNNKIEVSFPRGQVNKVAAPENAVSPKEVAPAPANTTKKVSKDALNEDYLNGLMNENKPKAEDKQAKKDEVSVKQAAVVQVEEVKANANKNSDGFSFAGYALKFTVFLALVLGLFYGVVQLFKKGVFSRGKLGFLNNAQMIEVLSTTYVSPKRSLMVVRAHKQIFLVANSESGLAFLSEMKDTSGLIKEGEKIITGSNFDDKLTDAETSHLVDAYRIKEDIMESSPLPAEGGFAKLASAKDDIVKFSDELKKKAKKLKPIENRAN